MYSIIYSCKVEYYYLGADKEKKKYKIQKL